MAEADRRRLLEKALALPHASAADFFGGRRPPSDADPDLLRRINDTALRTKLVDVGLAEGLQSPKGPQKIASILRIYPAFDAPPPVKRGENGRARVATRAKAPKTAQSRPHLPSIEELERLINRVRELEGSIVAELAGEADRRIGQLKREIAHLEGEALERAHRELGDALAHRRALESQTRHEAFRRIEQDAAFAERVHLRLVRR